MGGTVHLVAGGVYRVPCVLSVPGTRLRGHGAAIVGIRGPALVVPAGASDIAVEDVTATCEDYDQAAIRLGANDETQALPELEPHHITLTRVTVPSHRGKRGIEVNARAVELTDCSVLDTWDPYGRESQGLCVLNSSGSLLVVGGTYEAGSINILVGGDTMKMAGVVTRDLLFDGVTLRKPLSWRTDGVSRAVKNLFELKAGVGATLRNFTASGSWADGQSGSAIVLTPRDGRHVDDVLIENGVIADAGSGFQIMGRDYYTFTDGTMHVRIRNVDLTTRAEHNGHGLFAMVSGEPGRVDITDCYGDLSGHSLVLAHQGDVMEADGSVRPGGPIGELCLTGYEGTRPEWGLMLWGNANGGPNGEGLTAATVLDVRDNIFRGESSDVVMRRNFPNNTYLP